MKMIIGGKPCDASDKAVIEVLNPATMEKIDTVPAATKQDVDNAIKNARLGFKEWSAVPLYRRIEILNKFADILEERTEELAQTMCREVGKGITFCRGEVAEAVVIFRGYCEKARGLNGEIIPFNTERRTENDMILTIREPIGIIGCIIPFNYPSEIYSHKVAPALVVGNSVVIKPSSDTPLGNILLTQWLVEAGVPGNAVQIVTGRGSQVGKWIVENPDVNLVSLTGSTEVGIETMTGCGKHLHQCHLELGGNDPIIMLEDCDLDKAVYESIDGRCFNAGQSCCANKRFLVQNTIKEKYIDKIIEGLKKLVIGDPQKEETYFGPVISEKAAIKIEEQIKHTIKQGAKCVYGGKRYNKTFIEPTVLIDVTPDMDAAKDMEIFGPVFPVIGFDTVEEAIEIANQIPFGLQSAVMTQDINKAMKVAFAMEAGACIINSNCNYRSAYQPFGGHKMTGMGHEGIAYTLEEMTQKKTIVLKSIKA